jgi:hypothetical protein
MSALGATLVWDTVTREQWQEWMRQAGRSNLLQSWAYGSARAEASGWRARRGVIFRHEEPVALVQGLEKRVGGLVRVTRVNRGPVFLTDVSPDDLRAVWGVMARLGNLWRGRLLSVAPEIPLSGSALLLMAELGFRQRSPMAWESAWIDLSRDQDVLRKQLHGKWRNMLTVSEKSGLTIEIGTDSGLFEWMLARHNESMREKDFAGLPTELLRGLRTHLRPDEQLLVLRASHDGEPVAGVCVALHGLAATYLLGWNGVHGRTLRANQFLLWRAMVHLKQSGLRWFDVGGIDEERTPAIAAFKLGLAGERYELVGEFWKW